MTKRISEEKLYRICSLSYRLVLGAFIALFIVFRFLSLPGDMEGDWSNTDYLGVTGAIISGVILTILPDISERHASIKAFLRYLAAILVLAIAIFGIYGLYGYDFSAVEIILIIINILFVVICAPLLKGLIKDKI